VAPSAQPPFPLGVSNVNLANRKAYLDSLLISNQSVANSFTIVNYVTDVLAVDIPDSVKVLESKKELLVGAGLGDFTVGRLQLLKYDHETLSAALEAKAAPETHGEADEAVMTIDDSIKEGIADFSS
jgi:hypothetical protein